MIMKGGFYMHQKNKAFTNASKQINTTISTGPGGIPRERYHPGDSVAKHKTIEDGNLLHAEDEIKQQNENL